ncbi:MAG TPA: PD-(D/E)XK motif protein [Terriglobia bacterium]|nr:PD-(D/E)XK motif protein [Terriglobia bacterium]
MISSSRHLTPAALEEYLTARPTSTVRIPGDPEAWLVFGPGRSGGMALRIAWDGTEVPDLSAYEHLSAAVVRTGQQAWAELGIDDADVARRAFPVIQMIIDRVQLEHASFDGAVVKTLEDFRELLVGAPRLAADREVGIAGELRVLDHLMTTLGTREAIEAWRGPSREEHDFDLGVGDVEVKTTLAETRTHWIGSLTQLEPLPGRRLWLLSIQLTTGQTDAPTLPDMIAALCARLSESERMAFEARLRHAGWHDSYHATARRRFQLRSAPLLLAVDAEFPALTRARVAAGGMPLERLRELAYLIDVTGMMSAEASPPPALAGLLARGRPDE